MSLTVEQRQKIKAELNAKGPGRPKIHTPEFIENEADELLKWCALPSSLYMLQFTAIRQYPQENLSRWGHENEKFSQSLKTAKEAIASRAVVGALRNELNATVVMKLLPMYDKAYKQMNRAEKEFDAALKEKAEKSGAETLAQAMIAYKKNI